jgi:hypothetical protein
MRGDTHGNESDYSKKLLLNLLERTGLGLLGTTFVLLSALQHRHKDLLDPNNGTLQTTSSTAIETQSSWRRHAGSEQRSGCATAADGTGAVHLPLGQPVLAQKQSTPRSCTLDAFCSLMTLHWSAPSGVTKTLYHLLLLTAT